MEVALPEGKYSLLNKNDNIIFETKIKVASDERYLLAQNSMTQGSAEETVFRGDRNTEKKAQKKVIINNENIKHGGYIAVVDQTTRINGNWANLAGGKAAWIINHSYSLGGEGYGLVYPTDREDFTGAEYDGLDTEIGLGFGGVLFEYFIWPDGIFTIAPGIMAGAGGIEYYNPDDEDKNEDQKSTSDVFFIIMPEVNVYVNITEYVRIGAGVSYRMVNGINQPHLSDRDMSGFSFSLAVAAGFF